MKFFRRLKMTLTYGPELDRLLEKERKDREREEREANQHRLHLCFDHRQEANRSHYAKHNCDHCKLQERLRKWERLEAKEAEYRRQVEEG